MAREKKVFRASVRQPTETDAILFDLECEDADGNVVETHEFTAFGAADDAGIGMTIVDFVRYNDQGRQVADLHAIKGLLRRVLPEAQYALFLSLLDRQDVYLQMETLGDIYQYLLEEFTGRPKAPSKGFANGRPNGGRKSTEQHSLQDAT